MSERNADKLNVEERSTSGSANRMLAKNQSGPVATENDFRKCDLD
jgi:hypothetical protein